MRNENEQLGKKWENFVIHKANDYCFKPVKKNVSLFLA